VTDNDLNPEFLQNLSIYFGDRAKVFLDGLPELIKTYEATWNIKVLAPFPELSFNFVAPAVGPNNEAYVFKCGVPNSELITEIDALAFMDGSGLPKLIQASKEDAVLLQERIKPGISLRSELRQGRLTDSEATEVAAIAMKDFLERASSPIPTKYSFPHITDWLQALEYLKPDYDNRKAVFPIEVLERSEVLLPELLTSMNQSSLLHGDFHHDNIVSYNESWMVIDPKGILGEASYEVGAFLRNPHELVNYKNLTSTNLKSIMHKRIDIFAEVLGLEPERMAAWSIVQSVLSVWWSIQGNSSIQKNSDLDDWSVLTFESALAVCDLV